MRRKTVRDLKRKAFLRQYDNFANICNRQNLFDAEVDARKNVMWKGSVQRWDIDRLLNNEKLYRDLLAGKSMCKGFSKYYRRFMLKGLFMTTQPAKKAKALILRWTDLQHI